MALAGPPRLVVLRALGLGDLLGAVPALAGLARAFPRHERVLAAPAALSPIAALIESGPGEPAVHRVVHTGQLEPLSGELHGAAVAVNLHGRGPQSHRLLLASKAGRFLWFENADAPESAGAPTWHPGEREVARWCRMLREQGVPADPAELDLARPEGAAPPGAEGATLIHPGAASGARRWPPERFATVARAEAGRGRDVVITGGREEYGLALSIARPSGLPSSAVLAGKTDLAALARAVAAADRVVCGDTGVAHLATALGTPSVLVFGPTSPTEWGPPAERARHRVLWAGRTGDPHAMRPHGGLLEVTACEVIAALGELPARSELAPAAA